ncbi:MAG TPA: hypothetical protein VMM76_27220 [Pirellulaceae bacterium]|nr:hypothetical protein [Pirellulaceae bacterium]
MTPYLETLERAISDVGHWTWWDGQPSESIQLEFGGVQLWNEPVNEGEAPSGLIALRFEAPELVAFITLDGVQNLLPEDWPQRMQNDELDTWGISHGEFTLRSRELATELIAQSHHIQVMHGPPVDKFAAITSPCLLAFRAGSVGAIVAASTMTILSMAGEVKPDEVIAKSERWWAYWREYWIRMDTDAPLPHDYACEVTIPGGDDTEDE